MRNIDTHIYAMYIYTYTYIHIYDQKAEGRLFMRRESMEGWKEKMREDYREANSV